MADDDREGETETKPLPDERDLDEQVATALIDGNSARQVRKQFGLSAAAMDAILARVWPIDDRARIAMVRTDAAKLDRLLAVFYAKAITERDSMAASVCTKLWERKHHLLGLDA